MAAPLDPPLRDALFRYPVIPACPLALTAERRLDERRHRALVRYYLAAGAAGLAVGVHTTQFAIRDPRVGLFKPVLQLAAEELNRAGRSVIRIAGVCGLTAQALDEAAVARDFGYHAALVSLTALARATEDALLVHCRRVGEVLPLVGFYLQPAVGGRVLPYSFWRRLAEVESLVAVKIAPFNRYQTLDVVRAVAEAGREVALWTGNDDNILADLLTPFRFAPPRGPAARRITGGLLGQWAVWTRRAVELADECRRLAEGGGTVPAEMLARNAELTDANAAVFDAANGFRGCIAGVHEVLRRQGLLGGTWCLDPDETLGPGQAEEIDRVCRAYPHLTDDDFVRDRLADWLRP